MKLYALVVAVIVICSAGFAFAADIYVWTDDKGVKHFSNQSPPEDAVIFLSAADQQKNSPQLKTPTEEDRSPDARVDEEIIELRRLLEELQQQLEANRQFPVDESLPNGPSAEYSEVEFFEPSVEPFGEYITPRPRYSSRSNYPQPLCYNYGRFLRGYPCGKSFYTYYPGVRRHYYHSQHRHTGTNYQYYKKPRYGHHLKSNRFTNREQRYNQNRLHNRGHRAGSAVRVRAGGIRTGVRIGHRR